MPKKDLAIAPLLEGLMILVVGAAGWVTHQPLLFTSLGPTAYEMIEMPHRRSARPYNIIVGNAIGVAAGFAALMLTHAWKVPAISEHGVPLLRVWATVLATLVTVFGTLLVKASQPAALSTTLLVSAGMMQTWKDAVVIMVAVLIMVAVGEPLRRRRCSSMTMQEKG